MGKAWFKNNGGYISEGPEWCWYNTANERSRTHYRTERQQL